MIVINNLLNQQEINDLLPFLKEATWTDGASTAGHVSKSVKNNEQLADDDPLGIHLGNLIAAKMHATQSFYSYAKPRHMHPLRFNKYENGGEYGTHYDGVLMNIPNTAVTFRPDLSATIFLTNPDDYEGGELEVEGTQHKLPAGDMLVYPSNTLHRVLPVTKGARISAITWMQSLVPEEAERRLLFELDQVRAMYPDDVKLAHVYSNLLRRWMQP